MARLEFTLENVKKLYIPREEYMRRRANAYINQIQQDIINAAQTGEKAIRVEKKGDVGFITNIIKDHFSNLGFGIRDLAGHFLIEGWENEPAPKKKKHAKKS